MVILSRIVRDNQLVDEILLGVTNELTRRNSGLVIGGRLDPLFAENARQIVFESLACLRLPADCSDLVTVDYDTSQKLFSTGRTRAEQTRHPAESLMAAEVIFGVALPLFVDHLQTFEDFTFVPDTEVAMAVHHSIWRRFPPGAIAYVEVMLEKLAFANAESRKQVSRELHDRVAHGILAALQRLELSQLQAPNESSESLRSAQSILRATLIDVQDIAVALRELVGTRPLGEALTDFVDNLEPGQPVTRVQSDGSPIELPAAVKEELFTIAIEAIRNARKHAKSARRVDVTLTWTSEDLVLEVENDGDTIHSQFARPGGLGLLSMQERTQVIGGQFRIETGHDVARVLVTMPLSKSAS